MKTVAFVLLSVILINRPSAAATFVTLPPIPGLPSNSPSPQYNGIDGHNIVGNYSDASGGHGFLYDGTGYVTLDDPLAPTGIGTHPSGISGQNIVGNYIGASGRFSGFLFDGSSYRTIDHPGADFTELTAISGNKMVGFYGLGGVDHSFIYDGSTFTPLDDPFAANGADTTDGLGTHATGISGNKVVGIYADTTGVVRSFLFDGANYSDLSYPGSDATFVNGIDGNNIVGTFYHADPNNPISGFLYNDLTKTWTELDYPEAFRTEAYGISGNMIVGNYYPFNTGAGPEPGFLATVPEPSSLILLAIAGLSFAGIARARRAKRVLAKIIGEWL